MMNFKGFFVGAAMLVAVPGMAAAAVIDFDALDAGALQTVPLTTFTEDGFTFELTYSGPGEGAAIFDSTCTGYSSNCNGDLDLSPVVQGENGVEGNILILQENRPSAPTPNDEASSGSITLTLVSGSAFIFEGASVIDDQPITFSSSIDGLLGTVDAGSDRDTATIAFTSSVLGIGDSFTISYAGSGGVDSLVLAAVPLPAGIALMLTGLGGLVVVRRRNKAKA